VTLARRTYLATMETTVSDVDRLHDALERLIADQSPRFHALFLRDRECMLLRCAQVVRGVTSPGPTDTFREGLRATLGIAQRCHHREL
jgi:hypothetical protein